MLDPLKIGDRVICEYNNNWICGFVSYVGKINGKINGISVYDHINKANLLLIPHQCVHKVNAFPGDTVQHVYSPDKGVISKFDSYYNGVEIAWEVHLRGGVKGCWADRLLTLHSLSPINLMPKSIIEAVIRKSGALETQPSAPASSQDRLIQLQEIFYDKLNKPEHEEEYFALTGRKRPRFLGR